MAAHDFRLHHVVSKLLANLCDDETRMAPEVQAEELSRSIGPHTATQRASMAARTTVLQHSPDADAFNAKYQEIHASQARELDPLVFVLSEIIDDPRVMRMMAAARGSNTRPSQRTAAYHVTASVSTDGQGADALADFAAVREQLAHMTASLPPPEVPSLDPEQLRLQERKAAKMAELPKTPEWVEKRAYLTMGFPKITPKDPAPALPIGSLPSEIQEMAVMSDLLSLLGGADGKYIFRNPPAPAAAGTFSMRGNRMLATLTTSGPQPFEPPTFQLDPSMDEPLKNFAQRVLPLSAYYANITDYVEANEFYTTGTVNQALAAAMRSLLKEYHILLAQLETQFNKETLNLQKLWFYVQPCLQTMSTLASIVTDIRKGHCEGGAVLSLLHERTTNSLGDHSTQMLCLNLTKAASAPYLAILEGWIYRGIVDDTYSEFLVEEAEEFLPEKLSREYNNDYWEHGYTIVQDRVPVFLTKVADKILSTGKYLNVIRQCGRDVRFPEAEEIVYTLKERAYVDIIERAYDYASRILVELMMGEAQLQARLSSMKSYFLMSQGDFFLTFMDLVSDELQKGLPDVMPTRMEMLLELALRTSSANADPFKDDLRCDFVPYNLVTELFRIMNVSHDYKGHERAQAFVSPSRFTMDTSGDVPASDRVKGLEAFTFEYSVSWPLSLVVSKKAIKHYQLLFRHLFHTKHVERHLCSTWVELQSAKRHDLERGHCLSKAFALRQRMLNFVQTIQYYMIFDVIEPSWHTMSEQLKDVTTIDDILRLHNDFLDTCLKECMLTSPLLLKTISKLFTLCDHFSEVFQRICQSARVEFARGTTTLTGADKIDARLLQIERNFTVTIHEFLELLERVAPSDSETPMGNLVSQLDINGFYHNIKTSGGSISGGGTPTSFITTSTPAMAGTDVALQPATSEHQVPPVRGVTKTTTVIRTTTSSGATSSPLATSSLTAGGARDTAGTASASSAASAAASSSALSADAAVGGGGPLSPASAAAGRVLKNKAHQDIVAKYRRK